MLPKWVISELITILLYQCEDEVCGCELVCRGTAVKYPFDNFLLTISDLGALVDKIFHQV